MALRTVTPVVLAANVASADLVAGADLSATINTADTFQIVTPLRTADLMIIISFAGTTVVTFNAGANPPSLRSPLGSITVSGTNGVVKMLLLEGGRFIQAGSSGMSITGSNLGADCKMAAYRVARTG